MNNELKPEKGIGMKYRIVKISEETYRIQEQVRQFVFFGKFVWRDMLCMSDYSWEGNLQSAHFQLKKLVDRYKQHKNLEVVYEITI